MVFAHAPYIQTGTKKTPHLARQLVKKGGHNAKIKAPSNHIKGSGMWKGGGEPSYSAMTIKLHDS